MIFVAPGNAWASADFERLWPRDFLVKKLAVGNGKLLWNNDLVVSVGAKPAA